MVGADLLKDSVRPLWEQRVRTDPHALRNSTTLLSQKLAAEIAKRRIYCLVPCPRNTLMWSHYAAKHSGICLEFYVSNLLFLKALKVNYSTEYPKFLPQDMQKLALEVILTKSKEWDYEQEFRIVGTPNRVGDQSLHLDGDYLRLPHRALESVIVGCKGDYDAVKKIVSEHAPYIKVKRAEIVSYQYQLRIINPEPDPEREAIVQKRRSQST
jgi:hypothetical protein